MNELEKMNIVQYSRFVLAELEAGNIIFETDEQRSHAEVLKGLLELVIEEPTDENIKAVLDHTANKLEQ